METLVVYDSKFGNTRQLAEIIAEAAKAHGCVRLLGLDKVLPQSLGAPDVLIIGGPTQAHGISARMRQFVDGLETGPANGTVAATFDTRYRMPRAISGSAAKSIARRLKRRGLHMFVPPESFFVTKDSAPQLESGETERAAAWAKRLVIRCALSRWCAA